MNDGVHIPMKDDALYQQLVAINNAEQQTYWTRYNIQVLVNTGLTGMRNERASLRQPQQARVVVPLTL